MNDTRNSGRESGRRISMELTADGARVTSLSLQGSRLVVTIEAELADSQMHAAPVDTPAPQAGQPLRTDTEFVSRSATSPVGGPQASPAVPDGPIAFSGMGSECLPPAPAPRAEPPEPAFADPGATLPDPALYAGSAPAAIATPAPPETDTQSIASTYDAPPPEQAPAMAETRGEPEPADEVDTVPQFSAPEPETPAMTMEKVFEIPDARMDVPPSMTATAPLPLPQPLPEAPRVTEQPVFTPNPVFADEPLAITEESSAIGGERHGEPQPTISFGLDGAAKPAPPPMPFVDFPAPAAPEPAPPMPIPGPAKPEPAAAPPEPSSTVDSQGGNGLGRGEPDGTTVLIRYTCPKCKTQGMQAVDKVGMVVNCSNCGKAMRLVMKK